MKLTITEQIIADRIREERRTFVKLLVLLLTEVGGAVLLLMRG